MVATDPSNESGEEVEALHVEDSIVRGGNKPFFKGTSNRKYFQAIIYTRSPVTFFTRAHINKMFGNNCNIQPPKEDDKFVDFSSNLIELAGALIG